jgi:hypothetical protein
MPPPAMPPSRSVQGGGGAGGRRESNLGAAKPRLWLLTRAQKRADHQTGCAPPV